MRRGLREPPQARAQGVIDNLSERLAAALDRFLEGCEELVVDVQSGSHHDACRWKTPSFPIGSVSGRGAAGEPAIAAEVLARLVAAYWAVFTKCCDIRLDFRILELRLCSTTVLHNFA